MKEIESIKIDFERLDEVFKKIRDNKYELNYRNVILNAAEI